MFCNQSHPIGLMVKQHKVLHRINRKGMLEIEIFLLCRIHVIQTKDDYEC